jgi:hypothetical protein
LQTCIDLQARVLCHLGTLVPSPTIVSVARARW